MQRRSLFRISASLALVGGSFGLAGCGGGSGDGSAMPGPAPSPGPAPAPAPAPVPRTFAYVANSESAEISIFQVDAGGVLNPVGSVPTGADTYPADIAFHPSGRFAYVANNFVGSPETVLVYTVDAATGMLTRSGSFDGGYSAAMVRIHPSGNFAYVDSASDGNLMVCSIDPDSGALTEVDDFNAYSADIAVHASGRFVYTAGYDDSVAAYAVQEDGRLTVVNAVGLPASDARFAPTVCVVPSGDFLYATNGDGLIFILPIDGATGALGDSTLDSGHGGYRIAIDPSGRFAYAAFEGAATGNTVSAYRIDATTGGLNSVAIKSVPNTVDALAVSPSGMFVYTANASTGRVSMFALNEGAGGLTELGSPVAAGAAPFGITVVTLTDPGT